MATSIEVCHWHKDNVGFKEISPHYPDDPYYMLVFDKTGVSLGDYSQWEETRAIEIIETNYR
jgi:hypothetical protein